jgi:hypothetical protein
LRCTASKIRLYAFLYNFIGAVAGVRNAVYFSTITYGVTGYSDAAMAEECRLVSAEWELIRGRHRLPHPQNVQIPVLLRQKATGLWAPTERKSLLTRP